MQGLQYLRVIKTHKKRRTSTTEWIYNLRPLPQPLDSNCVLLLHTRRHFEARTPRQKSFMQMSSFYSVLFLCFYSVILLLYCCVSILLYCCVSILLYCCVMRMVIIEITSKPSSTRLNHVLT